MIPEDDDRAVPSGIGADVSLRTTLASRRTVREFGQEAVPQELLEKCIDLAVSDMISAATAPDWAFVLVQAEDKRRAIGELSRAWGEAHAAGRGASPALQEVVGKGTGSVGLAPWIVVPCYRIGASPLEHDEAVDRYGRIFRAVQNLLLSFYAAGLGTRPSTAALHDPLHLCRLLELPGGMLPCFVIAVGWPTEPLTESSSAWGGSVTFLDDFSHPLSSSP